MRHRPSRRLAAALAVLVAAVAAPLVGAGPAAAANAPLVTQNGIAIKISDTAVTDGLLATMEADLQALVDQYLDDGGSNFGPLSQVAGFQGLDVAGDVELTFDALAPAPAHPSGGLTLVADIPDIDLTYTMEQWWHAPCTITVEPDPPATMTSKARVNPAMLPANPLLPLQASTGVWSATTPTETPTGVCWIYQSGGTNAFDWTGFTDRADPSSPASLIEDEVDTLLQGLVDDMWWGNTFPTVASLDPVFGLTFNQVRTDTHGFIVTANVNATGGLTLPGLGGPYNVSTAVDAGVSTNINTLMASTTLGSDPSDIIVSVHPNVTNQYLHALNQALGGDLGTTAISAGIELPLLNLADRPLYDNTQWSMHLDAQAAPEAHAVAGSGLPVLQLPQVTLTFLNPTLDPVDPRVATFSGAVSAVDLASLGTTAPVVPAYEVSAATWTATLTQADAQAAARVPPATATALEPWMREAVDAFLSSVPAYVTMDLQGLYGHPTTRYTTGLSYSGDQRYTETFDVA